MKKQFNSLKDLENEIKLNSIVEFKSIYLLNEVEKVLKDVKLESISRVFASREKAAFLSSKGNLDKFDEEVSISKSFDNKPQEEKDLLCFFKINFKSEVDKLNFIKNFNKDPNIKSISDDQIMQTNATPVPIPNDENYSSLWGMEKIKSRHVWGCSRGCGVVVSVIDTGVDYNHPDLNNNMWEFYPGIVGVNFTTDNASNFINPMDGHGHGTHVAGTIAAEGNNNFGVIGVAPASKIMAMKGLYNFGSGFLSDLANAINWSVFLGANVINNSWGPGLPNIPSTYFNSIISFTVSNNVTVVFAAGNSNMDTSLFHPNNHPNVIKVTATDASDTKASFSNFGNITDVAAPGVNIFSTLPGGAFSAMSGTSMAAPHVSGTIALIKSKFSNLDLNTIRNIVRTYVDLYTSPVYIGTGRISLENLEEILCNCGCSPCQMNEILKVRHVENKRNKKFKIALSQSCSQNGPIECSSIPFPNFSPCLELHWGDSALDNIETHDTEIAYLRICNKYKNLNFKGLTISEITITPNQVLPDGEMSVRIIPEELICFDSIGPCSCQSREIAIHTRNAVPGNYSINFKYCIESVEILGKNQFIDVIPINLISS